RQARWQESARGHAACETTRHHELARTRGRRSSSASFPAVQHLVGPSGPHYGRSPFRVSLDGLFVATTMSGLLFMALSVGINDAVLAGPGSGRVEGNGR